MASVELDESKKRLAAAFQKLEYYLNKTSETNNLANTVELQSKIEFLTEENKLLLDKFTKLGHEHKALRIKCEALQKQNLEVKNGLSSSIDSIESLLNKKNVNNKRKDPQ